MRSGVSDTDRATTGILQPLRRLARRRQDERVRPRRERLQRAVLLVVHARVVRDLRQIAAHQREVMMLVGLADARDALHRLFVADVAAERIAGIRRIHDDAAGADQRDRLPDEARLRVLRVDLEVTTGHPLFLYRESRSGRVGSQV